MILKIEIFKTLEKWSESLKEFMINNDKSVLLYGGLFLVGLAIFGIAYNALHRD